MERNARSVSWFVLLVTMLVAAACSPNIRDNVDPRLSDFEIVIPGEPGEGPWVEPQCSPVPPSVETPCSGLCTKPCQKAICTDGGWKIVDINPDRTCKKLPSGKFGPACMRDPKTKVCPDQCALCL